MPSEVMEEELWPQRRRLPLGNGWSGNCTVPGDASAPSREQLKRFCNLGYAAGCARLPSSRAWDAVRFCATREGGGTIALCYVLERDHAPGEQGILEYHTAPGLWRNPHPDARVQRMAECYLRSYLEHHCG
jgi:hypothetical protein